MSVDTDVDKGNSAIRAHDIAVCLERTSVPEFDTLHCLGMATRLALHLRGVPAVTFDVIKNVAIYLLDFQSQAVRPVLELLHEAEFVQLVTEGKTIKTVIPNIPFYDGIFTRLDEMHESGCFSEHEQFALDLVNRLSQTPLIKENAYQVGAERKLVERVLSIGTAGAFISERRARGRDVLIAPTYFSESGDAYADLVAAHGARRVKKVFALLRENQGWPLALIIASAQIGGVSLDPEEVAIARRLAGDGFIPPPAIDTSHGGTNHFLFGPRPGSTQLPPFKRPMYEAAMALVAAVRQGQLLPERFRIKYPRLLLTRLKERGYIKANSEASEQYRQLTALRVGRLEHSFGDRYRFRLIARPENVEAIDLALMMIGGEEPQVGADQDIVLALRQGETYVESLIGTKRLLADRAVPIDAETQDAIDEFLLRGAR